MRNESEGGCNIAAEVGRGNAAPSTDLDLAPAACGRRY